MDWEICLHFDFFFDERLVCLRNETSLSSNDVPYLGRRGALGSHWHQQNMFNNQITKKKDSLKPKNFPYKLAADMYITTSAQKVGRH